MSSETSERGIFGFHLSVLSLREAMKLRRVGQGEAARFHHNVISSPFYSSTRVDSIHFNCSFPPPFLTCFPYRRSPSAFFEGTHDVRSAWGNTRCSHKKVSFSCYATRSRAKKSTLARSLVLIVKLDARYGRRLAAPIPSAKSQIPCISTP